MSHFKNRIRIFRYPAFCWYLISCTLASTGAGLSYIAMTWMALSDNNSIGSVAILMLCFWMPNVILGPFMGVVVDRFPRRNHLLAASNWIRAIALLIFGIVFYYHNSLAALYLMGIILGTFFSVFIPAAFRLTREIVPENELLYANATVDTAFEVGNIVGMGLAGAFIALVKAPGTLIINAAMFIIAGVALIFIKRSHLNITYDEHTKLDVLGDFKAGLNYIFTHKPVFVIYTIQLLLFLEYLTAPVLLAPYARNQLHANVSQFGYIEMSLSFGAVFGGIFLTWLADKFGLLKTSLITSILLGGCYIYFSVNHSILLAELLYFVVGICFAMWPLLITRAQHITDISYQGRVQSCFMSISGVLMVIIYLGVKFLAGIIGIGVFYWVEVVFVIISIILIIFFEYFFKAEKE